MPESHSPQAQEVLIVDDNRDLAENVGELFAEAGYRVRTVWDGESAVAAALERPFDLAVIDIRMPGLSGIEITSQLRHVCGESEVILMTANATLDTAIAAVRQDAYAYVQKPFDAEELLSLGQRALDQVNLRRERSRLEHQLARSEALYRGVVDAVEAYIVGLGDEGEIRMWNRPAALATGWDSEALSGRPLAELIPTEPSRTRLAEAMERVCAGQDVVDLELPLGTRSGAHRIVRWQLSRFTRGEPHAPSVLAVGTDLTDRLDLERRAAEAEAMASIATLTTGLAHEVRNPLNAAALQLELIARAAGRLDDQPARAAIGQRVGIVREELERLTRMLSDFLGLARPRALALTDVELCPLVREVLALQEPTAGAAGVRLRLLAPEDEHPFVRADPGMLKQVLVNLVNNSLEALRGRDGGEVRIRCYSTSDSRVEISVEDNGPGVPPETREQMFAPFVTSKEGGTGLGLTIVKRIIDRHGGTVQVSSEAGSGTCVRLTLDRAAPA